LKRGVATLMDLSNETHQQWPPVPTSLNYCLYQRQHRVFKLPEPRHQNDSKCRSLLSLGPSLPAPALCPSDRCLFRLSVAPLRPARSEHSRSLGRPSRLECCAGQGFAPPRRETEDRKRCTGTSATSESAMGSEVLGIDVLADFSKSSVSRSLTFFFGPLIALS
jgi:hypothetical protein